jgi:hypothetical protein
MSVVTMLPAPIMARLPMRTPGMMTAFSRRIAGGFFHSAATAGRRANGARWGRARGNAARLRPAEGSIDVQAS